MSLYMDILPYTNLGMLISYAFFGLVDLGLSVSSHSDTDTDTDYEIECELKTRNTVTFSPSVCLSVCLSVCVSVCNHDNSKNNGSIH